MTDTKRDVLLRALTEQAAAEEDLFASASEEDRSATGTYERWSLRDNIAHLAHWRRSLAALLAERRNGGPGIDEDDTEDLENARVHAEWRDRSWDEVVAAWRAGTDAMVDEVRQWDEDAITGPWDEGHTVYVRVAGNSLWHPASHLATWLQENGRAAEGLEHYRDTVRRVTSVDDSDGARGTALYNLACFDALGGNKAAALANLAEAFEKRPDLIAYATEDTDLSSLHDDPDFRALLPQH